MRRTFLPALGGIAVVVVSFTATVHLLDWLSGPTLVPRSNKSAAATGTSTSDLGAAITHPSTATDLPKIPLAGHNWIGIDGLNAQIQAGAPAADGQPVWQLVAVPVDGRHYVSQVVAVGKNGPYRVTLWVKPKAGANLQIEAGDHAPSGASYINALFDLTQHLVTGSGYPGTAPAFDDWQRVWVDVPTTTGQLFISIYVLAEDGNNTFKGNGRTGLMLGGISVDPRG